MTQGGLPILGSMELPDMLCASTIRSTIACGEIVGIRKPSLPAGYVCVLPSDLESEGISNVLDGGMPVFAASSVSYRGEPLGLIIGPDQTVCDELSRSVSVEYRESEAFPDWESFSSKQIAFRRSARQGDPDKAFMSAWKTDSAVYRSGVFDHRYSEPMGALAFWEYDKLVIRCATQWPLHVRDSVAACLRADHSDILVRPTNLGRALDGRIWYPSLVACQAAIAARIFRKPVRLLFTRLEDFGYTPKQACSRISIDSAISEKGKLEALDIRIVINIGAYNILAAELVAQAMAAMTGIYSCPSIRIEAYAVKSNVVPLGALGGIGSTHAFFSIEAHTNHLAKVLQKPLAEFKSQNLLEKGSSHFGALPMESEIPFEKLTRALESISDYRRKYASYELVRKRDPACREGIVRGIAITIGYQSANSFAGSPRWNGYAVEACLEKNLDLVIRTQAAVASEDALAMWRSTAASILSIPEERVLFAPPDTDSTAACGPMTLSRAASVMNRLVDRACRAIQKRRFRDALPIRVRAQGSAGKSLAWRGEQLSGQPFDSVSWCGTAVEVEIDPLTGEPRPLSVWMVIDAGKIVSKERAASSLRSSIVRVLEMCTGREFDTSADPGTIYGSEKSPSSGGLPSIGIEFLPGQSAAARGIGELPFVTVPAAFYSALTQAMGIEPRQIPIHGPEILRLMEAP